MKKQPINKRWPGKFSVRAVVYTPKGNRLGMETDLTDEDGKKLLELLIAAVNKPESKIDQVSPVQRKTLCQ
jgi:hypothetical protein